MNNIDVTDRVSDAPSGNWVYRILPKSVWPYAQLARWDRPIGWWLLLWPCWWSVMLAVVYSQHIQPSQFTSQGVVYILLIFLLGAVFMRGAGCTYNDLIDADLDGKVERTKSRPIPSGRVSKAATKLFLGAQLLAGFLVLLLLCAFSGSFNFFAFWLAIASLGIVALYPFAKRVTDWPQFVLGLAFSWGALMGFAVMFGFLTVAPLLLYVGCVLWTIGYDTIYAHQDREDDALVGVRSTARLFGEKTKPALILLYSGTVLLFAMAFSTGHAGWPAYVGLLLGGMQMISQITRLDIDDGKKCLALFHSNGLFGWVIFIGLLVDVYI